ncbi:hypothetical protein DPMN_036108 [Dreissena polymorpha]|uniref:Uncharacterized protein n=1 Tax=Dreissena polymorpha TaxID=45954 RepID=A0A9D4M8U8_DREPO|nr:hypothetical protein DPMN_036108 [Dreissena polymorpha]
MLAKLCGQSSAKIVADGRVVADMFPDWSQVLNGDRITTNAHHSPNGNYGHQSLSLKPHQYEVNHKSVYGDETFHMPRSTTILQTATIVQNHLVQNPNNLKGTISPLLAMRCPLHKSRSTVKSTIHSP